MKIVNVVLIGIMLLSAWNCKAQTVDLKLLRSDFEKDTSGCLSIRSKYISIERKPKQNPITLIGGVDLRGKSMDSVLVLLGKPNQAYSRSEYLRANGTTFLINNLWYVFYCGSIRKMLLISSFSDKVISVEIVTTKGM